MVQKLSKDVYFEIDQIDQQIQRLKKRIDQNNYVSENQNPNLRVSDFLGSQYNSAGLNE